MKEEIDDIQGRDRKYRLSLISLTLMAVVGLLAMQYPSFAPLYADFIGGVIGINLVFAGGNVGAKWVFSKALTGSPKSKKKSDAEKSE